MESNKNNGGDEHDQQLRGGARKRTFSEVTNYEDKPAAGEEDQPEPEDCSSSSKKNREDGNDLDLEESWKLETSTTTMADPDLPPSAGRHRKLPPELNCQIFYCLNLPTRRKFILELGWDFYAMFRRSLLIKSKRVCNPKANVWRRSSGDVTISEDGLNASNSTNGRQNIYAEKGFPISVAECRKDGFPGTICYYYEVKSSERFTTGFVHGGFVIGVCVGESNYVIATISTDGRQYEYTEVPVGARPEPPNVFGCGLLMDPDNKVAIFFTLNGILLGKQISISPSVDCLFPAVLIGENVSTFEANFGNDKEKPFKYDIKKCPGMGLDCI